MSNSLTIRTLTKDEIAQSAIAELTARGSRVRKVANVAAYKKRRHQVQKGWSDIEGYDKEGRCILCEVKTINDRFSTDQIERLDDLDKCGGIALVAIQKNYTVQILNWKDVKPGL